MVRPADTLTRLEPELTDLRRLEVSNSLSNGRNNFTIQPYASCGIAMDLRSDHARFSFRAPLLES